MSKQDFKSVSERVARNADACRIAGIVSVCASYGILKKRNAAICAAYAACHKKVDIAERS